MPGVGFEPTRGVDTPLDPESSASASSATPAGLGILRSTFSLSRQILRQEKKGWKREKAKGKGLGEDSDLTPWPGSR